MEISEIKIVDKGQGTTAPCKGLLLSKAMKILDLLYSNVSNIVLS